MELAIVTHKVTKGDGQGRVNYEICQAAIRRGHNLTLLASDIAPEFVPSNRIRLVRIPTERIPTELLKNLFFAKISSRWLTKNRKKLDLVMANGAITSTQADVNSVHFVHNTWLSCPSHTYRIRQDYYGLYQWLYTVLNAHWEKKAFWNAKVVVAVSAKVEKDIFELGIPQNRIRKILNGVDLNEFSPGYEDRRQLHLPENVTLAFFAGDICTPRKNLASILYALAQVPELHLVVAGDAKASTYPRLATKLGLKERVHFLGYRNDLANIMRAVDLFVFPSHYETYGLVLLEAMATGLPVITARSVGVSEIITPECGIVLFDSNDVDGLKKAILDLVSSSEKRKRMGMTARAVAEKFSWKNMANSYIDLFEELKQ